MFIPHGIFAMTDLASVKPPAQFDAMQRDTAQAGFDKASEPLTGALLRTLAAYKPGGKFLEIGTGTGIGTCWLLDGMDANSTLTTIDKDSTVNAIARRHLAPDRRVTFLTADAEVFLKSLEKQAYDLIFADTFPGKFYLLDEVLA